VDKPQLSILYVDDHDDTRRVVSRLLTLLGHQVTTASSVQTALTAARASDFHLLISDIGLPDGDGRGLLRELLAIKPIISIAISGYNREDAVQDNLAEGFSEHLVKPVTLDQLSAAIERARSKVLRT
jgi:CheY-like chemotaxis protein